MNVLIVGSGGREHALAWKIAQSPRLSRLYIAPGNAGTAGLGENIPLPITGDGAQSRLAAFAQEAHIDLVVIGPETPLAEGLADRLRQPAAVTDRPIAVFGPSQAAAQIEASKVFAKEFMERHGIPTGRYAAFSDFESAREYLHRCDAPPVVKASGLSAGKGVIVPETFSEAEAALRSILLGGDLGLAGREVILEERLEGDEVSLLAFTDGKTVRVMPPAQDHKRLLDGDRGPNTGGMGAYAPAPVCPPGLQIELAQTVLQRTVDGLRSEGRPFSGVLYAGLILTRGGPRVLEFNCRFGDPETQALLPLLESDLLEIALACAEGRLAEVEVAWKKNAAACVVLAAPGYPAKALTGQRIRGLEEMPGAESMADGNTVVFHAGTKLVDGQVCTAGGRVLGITAWGESLAEALNKAYLGVAQVSFEGMQYRGDIGRSVDEAGYSLQGRSVNSDLSTNQSGYSLQGKESPYSYATAGVDIEAGNRAVELMKTSVQATYGEEVLAGIGAFGGLFDAQAIQRMHSPVLVASTDGVGTKVLLAAQVGSRGLLTAGGQQTAHGLLNAFGSIGRDLVNHCINDILVQGARPLFFMDYIASSHLEAEVVAQVVQGAAEACQEAGCALLGGETAEMPGIYTPASFDLAGTIVGVVERQRILPRLNLRAGDVLIGLRSSGPHTNGYSLIRQVFAGIPLETVLPGLDRSLGEVLLTPHRSYLPLLWPVLEHDASPVKALAHLTGGAFLENIPRILPQGLSARIQRGTWPVPAIFTLIQERGGISDLEMHRVFNMGIGMVAVVGPGEADEFQRRLGEETYRIGELAVTRQPAVTGQPTEGHRKVELI